jgi:acetyl esterase/lipase
VDALLGPVQQAAAGRLDLHQVTAIGHSAGGHLAVWLAGRPRLPSGAPGAGPAVPVGAVIALAPVVDLEQAVVSGGDRNVVNLMGGTPAEQPTRYALGSPIRRLPVGIPVFCIHGDADTTVPVSQSQRYVAAAKVAGDPARLLELSGVTHSGVVDLSGEGWRVARTSLLNGA